MLKIGAVIGNYSLVRPLEKNESGEIWLCALPAGEAYRILKFVAVGDAAILEKKYATLSHYREIVERSGSSHLMRVEHCEKIADGFFYVVPVPDANNAKSPADPARISRTPASRIERRVRQLWEFEWFSCAEIKTEISAILDALELLHGENLLHGNVNPKSIFYVNGSPCLSEICLFDDVSKDSRYQTPANYSGALPDMYGAALTLFAFLTGNNPQRVSKTSYHCPPNGEAKLRPSERREWKRLCDLVLIALSESSAKRFKSFSDLKKEIQKGANIAGRSGHSFPVPAAVFGAFVIITAVAAFYANKRKNDGNPLPDSSAQLTGIPNTLPEVDPNAVTTALAAGASTDKSDRLPEKP